MKTVKAIVFSYAAILFLSSGMPYEHLITPPTDRPVYRQEQEQKKPGPPRRMVPEEYRDLFTAAAAFAGIPPGALESIAWAESRFCPEAKSPERDDECRDLGMFQFNSRYLGWYADRYNSGVPFDPMDTEEAIYIAAQHVRFLYECYGRWGDVFLAYNAGIGAVNRDEIPESAIRYLLKIYEEKPDGNL